MGKAFNHVGIGVADINAGVSFYTNAFDCRVVKPPIEVRADGPGGEQTVDVLGPPRFGRMFIAHLAMPDQCGVELFQVIDPPHEPRNSPLEYWRSGVFHFCVTDPDIEVRLQKLIDHGGKQLSKICINVPPDKRLVYCSDPWGTIIEIYTHAYADMYAA
jgi:catechol 2,3-dioxygenase-like lactoylglutathione lyase family enzyme